MQRKTSEYHSATNVEKCYYVSKIPSKYWKNYILPLPSTLTIEGYKKKVIRITKDEQIKWIEKFTQDKNQLRKNYIIGIGSVPTDNQGMKLACAIAKFAINNMLLTYRKYNVEMINASELSENKHDETLDMLILHNLLKDTTKERLQLVRDNLYYYNAAIRIVVIAGLDPVTFFTNKLRMKLNCAFHFKQGSILVL